jgi:hypothetical protein
MISQQGPHPDAARSRLRGLVDKVDQELSLLPTLVDAKDGSQPNGLRGAWAELVEQLALGPEPEVRDCPSCGHICMRTATICGHCWSKLPELA